jgi:hypothetical protein
MTYINHTNEELEFDIEQFEKQLARAQSEVTRLQRVLENAQAELARRKLEAFWQQNAGLRLAVGDAFVITDEYKQWYLQQDRTNVFIARFNRVYVISRLLISNDGLLQFDCEGLWFGEIPLDIARRMRLAYLQAHGEAVE